MEYLVYDDTKGFAVKPITKAKLYRIWQVIIDHSIYATFEDWMWDMKRMDLVREV